MTASASAFLARPELIGSFGMVATTHWLASQTGMGVLERGGNAFDAAVAIAFVLHVAEPHLNGPAGEVPVLFHAVRDGPGRVRALCGQGVAPVGATVEHYRAQGLDIVPGTGLLAATVPGAFDAWMLLLRDYGTWRLEDVLEPAIHYLEHGCPLVPRVVGTISSVAEMFRKEWTSSAEVWLPHGEVPVANEPFRNPQLAAVWLRLIREAKTGRGRDADIDAARAVWREGFIAEAIDRFVQSTEVWDNSGQHNRGVLTGADLAAWQASYDEPVSLDYHGHTVYKCGPWSQGPVFLQQLALLKGFDLTAMDPLGPEFVHTVVECMKLAFADRDGFYGDPDFVSVPLDVLLSDAYNDERRQLITEQASLENRPGIADNRRGWADPAAVGRGQRAPEFGFSALGEPTVRRDGATGGDTCHIDVIDRWGNMVSATPSGAWLQSSPAVPGLGFCLGTRAQMFFLDPASPSVLGPKRRPRTTLTPSFATRDGKPYMAFGTPGGDQQDQWSVVFFLRHVHHKMTIQQSIEAPMLTSEHWANSFWPRAAKPGRLLLEDRFPAATVAELRRRGHLAETVDPWSLGRLSAASKVGSVLKAGANPRGAQGYAVGR
ncbi:MAG: gamma-glutamyltransferase family protein [Alphaproteobacteria bacterium]|nr:MAG: gamma-glutamyltransferase family protein [Alphaproteobacteria bacterium]